MITTEILDWYYRTNPNQEISFYRVDDRAYVVEIKDGRKIKSFTIGYKTLNFIIKKFVFEKGRQLI